MKQTSLLAAKVAARNLVNATINEWAPKLRAIAAQFEGKNIELSSATLLRHNVKKAFQALALPNGAREGGAAVHAYVTSSGYLLKVSFYVDVPYSYSWHGELRHSSHRAEADLYLGDVHNGVLNKAYPDNGPFPTGFTVEAVEAARAAAKTARAALQQAENALCGFGEFDN